LFLCGWTHVGPRRRRDDCLRDAGRAGVSDSVSPVRSAMGPATGEPSPSGARTIGSNRRAARGPCCRRVSAHHSGNWSRLNCTVDCSLPSKDVRWILGRRAGDARRPPSVWAIPHGQSPSITRCYPPLGLWTSWQSRSGSSPTRAAR
jgi:hypothetical protein